MTETAHRPTPGARPLDLSKYESMENKKITLTYGLDDETVEVEGVLMAVAVGQGIMFRKRGSQKADLIKEDKVFGIAQIAESPKKVTAKKLKEVTLDNAREHLADRHGYKLEDVNNATPEQAMLAHDQIDHSDLGHNHDKDAAEAPADAATEAPAE